MGLLRAWYERAYRRGDSSRWDTGITPPELLALLETLEPGTALDLGCGTGTNAIELANRGWFVTGVDFSPLAIDHARRKAGWVSGVTFVEGDVSELSALGVDGPFDLAVDIGCFHSVAASRRDAYVREIARVLRSGAPLLMFAFGPWLRWPGSRRTREPEIRRRFARDFEVERVELGREPPGAAWFTLRRR
ncbi:MAG TPA: class I SAM-dependent methyltransferase [Actinomycetota bacterium]|jgi:SAM-dependent methyltransferase|nr:class I SAM-dependent methyltransferase [Actinomycetota bacterium]